MVGKVAKIVRIARAGARVHACFRPPRRVYEQRGAGVGREKRREMEEEGGGEGERIHIVLVLIYAARPAFLLPRYRDLSAANYTFTPFLAPSTLEHRKTRMILLPRALSPPPGTPRQQKQKTRTRPPAPHPFFSGWLLSFELSRSILSRWVKNKPSLTSAWLYAISRGGADTVKTRGPYAASKWLLPSETASSLSRCHASFRR